ncbi:Octopamine receptor beta-2R [Trichoplax sp. H2]|nr:Octopamine receptor beta-2R [Trichoplax sp. H2]|eukprot:RDD39263.1 Octopamine receptor beta-2R [Trichoplax sp. H2]
MESKNYSNQAQSNSSSLEFQHGLWGSIGVMTLLTNIFLFSMIVSCKRLRIISNYIIASMCFVGILIALLYLLPRWTIPIFYRDPFLCQILPALGQGLLLNLNFHVCLVSLERYIIILYPFWHRQYCCKKVLSWILLTVWFFTVSFPFIPLMTYQPIRQHGCNNYIVVDKAPNLIMYYIYFSVFFFFPVAILISTYTCIFSKIMSGESKVSKTNSPFVRKRKTLCHISIIVGLFIITWLPFVIAFFALQLREKTQAQLDVLTVTQYISFSYPAINPLLYTYYTNSIREEIIFNIKILLIKCGFDIRIDEPNGVPTRTVIYMHSRQLSAKKLFNNDNQSNKVATEISYMASSKSKSTLV